MHCVFYVINYRYSYQAKFTILLNFNLAAGWCRDFKFVALVKLIITSSNDCVFLARKF